MNNIEISFLELGLTWFLSKLLPYLLALLFGAFLFILLRRLLKGNRLQHWLSIPFIVLPFLIYFTFYPIYEGDFSNSFQRSKNKDILPSGGNRKLVVITIPNCPYCFESIQKLKIIHRRNPSLEIQFLVCTDNENDLLKSKTEAENSFKVEKQSAGKKLAILANYKFPTFLLFDKNQDIKIWNNDNFGVLAIDEVEQL